MKRVHLISRVREANVRALPIRGSVTRIEFARDALMFEYFRIRGSVCKLTVLCNILILRQCIIKICMPVTATKLKSGETIIYCIGSKTYN
jgi:hypothetical protein